MYLPTKNNNSINICAMTTLFATFVICLLSGYISWKIKSPIARSLFGALFFGVIMLLVSPGNTLAALFIGGSWALWIGKILTQVDDRRYFRKIIKERGYHFTVDKAMKDTKSLGKGREFIVQLWEQSSQISDEMINEFVTKTGKSENQLDWELYGDEKS